MDCVVVLSEVWKQRDPPTEPPRTPLLFKGGIGLCETDPTISDRVGAMCKFHPARRLLVSFVALLLAVYYLTTQFVRHKVTSPWRPLWIISIVFSIPLLSPVVTDWNIWWRFHSHVLIICFSWKRSSIKTCGCWVFFSHTQKRRPPPPFPLQISRIAILGTHLTKCEKSKQHQWKRRAIGSQEVNVLLFDPFSQVSPSHQCLQGNISTHLF